MPVSAEALRIHIDYTAWASLRLLAAAARLTPDQLDHDFETADGSVLETLVHLFAADRIWLARLTGGPTSPFMTDADHSLEALQNGWPPLLDRWKAFAAGLTDETAREEVSYADLKGKAWKQPLWQLMLHVVNHGTHHRGQVAGFLRSMNYAPPVLDLIAYYREQFPSQA